MARALLRSGDVRQASRWWTLAGIVILVAVAFVAWPGTRAAPATPHLLDVNAKKTAAIRASAAARSDALRRARVWRAPGDRPRVPLAPSTTSVGDAPSPLECRFLPDAPSGTTTKFDCVVGSGEVVKVKYGTTLEIQAEVAATRLLAHLGFGADSVSLVHRVRCYGCPRRPFEVAVAVDRLHMPDALRRGFSGERYVDFTWVAVERRFAAPAIESDEVEGWAWYELEQLPPLDPSHLAERDALKLVALLLAHWDNKASNQRLVCLDGPGTSAWDTSCARPFAFIQDLGATFGPNKVNLAHWKGAPIWVDAHRCTVSMRQMPYEGGTFPETRVSEAGRLLLLRELDTLTRSDLRAWLASARFDEPDAWVGAFLDRIQQIRDAGPCTSAI